MARHSWLIKVKEVKSLSYPNLEAEMARIGITNGDIALELGKDKSTISQWMNGAQRGFPIVCANKLRNKFFPGMQIDYLFSEQPAVQNIKS